MIPPAIAPKLAKLLLLLGSDKDGEVLAAARALCRTLAAAGTDLHALASAIAAHSTGPVVGPAATAHRAAAAWDTGTGNVDDGPIDFEAMRRRAWEEAAPDRHPPDEPARRWGMKLWGKGIEAWSTVAQHALMLDWTVPKASGGRFLTKGERQRLKAWTTSAPLTNAEAAWLESVVGRLHEACARMREPGKAA